MKCARRAPSAVSLAGQRIAKTVDIAERLSLTRASLERWLAALDEPQGERMALYVRPGQLSSDLEALPPACAGWLPEIKGLPASLVESETGLVLLWSGDRKYALVPPFPVDLDQCLPAWDTSHLRALLDRKYLVGVVLLRLGGYSVGVFEGERLLTSKTGTRFVKGRHKAGGRSQRRFARRREEQIRELFDKACTVVATKFAPYEGQLDYVFLGGDRLTLRAFLKRCEYLQRLADKTMARVLNVPEPRYETLRNAPSLIWKTRVFMVR
ncbi:MAG: acVLRF1 family peptidyl-tRNA hydrolase [Dehalococcoidia bacterium]